MLLPPQLLALSFCPSPSKLILASVPLSQRCEAEITASSVTVVDTQVESVQSVANSPCRLMSGRSFNLLRRKPLSNRNFIGHRTMSLVSAGAAEEESFEAVVGITAFANTSKPFNGILKQRFSDFIVREISLEGSPAYLNDVSAKELDSRYFSGMPTVEQPEGADAAEQVENYMKEVNALSEGICSGVDVEGFKRFICACVDKEETCAARFDDFANLDKATRTSMHRLVKSYFADCVETEAAQVDGVSMMRFLPKHLQKAGNKRKRIEWPTGLGNYLKFTLLKENIDTMSAVAVINKSLRCNSANGVQYSGTKDKRAVTAQRCTVYRRRPSDFDRINASSMTPTICVGDFEFVDAAVSLGELGGNRFEITLRALNTDNEQDVLDSCAAMQQSGFINYFGLQRFGKGGTRSHDFGKAILKSDWEACVKMLFTPRSGDRDHVEQGKRLFLEGKYGDALKYLPDALSSEKGVLRRLLQHPTDWIGAYNTIPKNARLLCLHAYQSYLWNKAASRRLELFGRRCEPGDLVALRLGDDKANQFQRSKQGGVVIATAADIAEHGYTVEDVVLPLTGFDIMLPENAVGEYMKELLAEDNMTLASYNNCNVAYRERGAYRRLLQYPKDFNWRVVSYDNPDEELAETELNKFRVARQPWDGAPVAAAAAGAGAGAGADVDTVPADPIDAVDLIADAAIDVVVDTSGGTSAEAAPGAPRYKALHLQFFLPPCYSTIRQITEESTETVFHAQLTKNEQAKQ
mmetsp:Transcript_5728/g.13088  ORF Transcript_5728/g.13088 Transcript_5728/m.13088 type:complete len:749 (+) Transcript_5728:23-2269(+)